MRILITFEYPFAKHGYGGGNQITRGFARAFGRLGHEVHVVCTGDDAIGVVGEDAPAQYHFAGAYNPRTAALQISGEAIRVARRLRPDLVICTTSEAGPLVPVARLLGIRVLVYVATPKLPMFRRIDGSYLRNVRYGWGTFLQFLGARGAHRVVTASESLLVEARERWGVPTERLAAVGLGIDETILGADVVPPPPLDQGVRLLSIGRIVHGQKPLDVMASGLAKVQRAWSSWTVIGSGEDEPQLRAHVAALGIAGRVRFLGTRLRDDIRQELDAAHIVLLPSRYEGHFSTVYEAASRGRVIVTNDVNDVVQSFAGTDSVLIAKSADADEYRRLIERAIDNFAELSRCAVDAADRVRSEETWEAVARRVLSAANAA
jgi:glycosyltransferase involved in cell wall biosynthesis